MIVFLEGSGSFVPSRHSPKKGPKKSNFTWFFGRRRGIRSSCVSLENSTCLVLTAIELETVTKRRTKRNGDGTRNCLFGSYKRGFSYPFLL